VKESFECLSGGERENLLRAPAHKIPGSRRREKVKSRGTGKKKAGGGQEEG